MGKIFAAWELPVPRKKTLNVNEKNNLSLGVKTITFSLSEFYDFRRCLSGNMFPRTYPNGQEKV